MKIALIGYGKMGKTIEEEAIARGHSIVCIIRNDTEDILSKLRKADVAIEFTKPEAAISNIENCFVSGIPVVCGTTGWYNDFASVKERCIRENQSLFTATNFSIGVNLFFYANKILAKAINKYPDYEVNIEEVHHVHKADAPSGTAITTAENIIAGLAKKDAWALSMNEKLAVKANEINIVSKRIDEVPGTHTVNYDSEIDSISITHTAHSRKGFAVGSVIAAEWLVNKKGVFSMNDLLGF